MKTAIEVLREIIDALEGRHRLKGGRDLRAWAASIVSEGRRLHQQIVIDEAQATLDAYDVLDRDGTRPVRS